jgi:hypothetical protein
MRPGRRETYRNQKQSSLTGRSRSQGSSSRRRRCSTGHPRRLLHLNVETRTMSNRSSRTIIQSGKWCCRNGRPDLWNRCASSLNRRFGRGKLTSSLEYSWLRVELARGRAQSILHRRMRVSPDLRQSQRMREIVVAFEQRRRSLHNFFANPERLLAALQVVPSGLVQGISTRAGQAGICVVQNASTVMKSLPAWYDNGSARGALHCVQSVTEFLHLCRLLLGGFILFDYDCARPPSERKTTKILTT